MTENPEAMLEGVLNALSQANGEPIALFKQLQQNWPEARTTALICTLLAAEHSIRVMFSESPHRETEVKLALSAALTLAEAANEIEIENPGHYVRLSDIIG